jgi:hypothetical protein
MQKIQVTEETVNFIRENINKLTTKEILEKTGLKLWKFDQIRSEFGIKAKSPNQWKYDLILEKYADIPKLETLEQMTGIKIHAIHEYARRKGVKRNVVEMRKGNLSKLLDGTMESYYWLGFYAADGYISKDGHFMLSQAEKDKYSVEKLAEFLETSVYEMPKSTGGYKTRQQQYRVNVSDKVVGKQIRDMFGINDGEKKTYTEISLDWMVVGDPRNVAFLIGFIDGDGYIGKTSITLQCYNSYMSVFKDLIQKIDNQNFTSGRIYLQHKVPQNDEYATYNIYSQPKRNLYQFAKEQNLPYSLRKWEKKFD